MPAHTPNPGELCAQLSGHKELYGKFDYIIHCAGATKCVDKNDFERVNYRQTKCFVDTLRELDMIPRQFVFISTLSVFGPIREKTNTPITEKDTPVPNTAYGLSKLKAERYLKVYRISLMSSIVLRVCTDRARRITS